MNTPRTRVPRRPVHGVLLLDKPLGLSSNDALQRAKHLLRGEKAGHTGTLDPLATGLLPLCFGAATKFSHLQLDAAKTYQARLRLGSTTRTGDAEGEVIRRRSVAVDRDAVQATLLRFVGASQQIPPMHSALKKDGKPLYEYARAGIEVERASRPVEIYSLTRLDDPTSCENDELCIEVSCSKGTYIRTLAEDIGEALGCGAHLIALRRTGSGQFGIEQCFTLEALQEMAEADRPACLLPIDSLLQGVPQISLGAEDAGRFLSGLPRRGDWVDSALAAVYASAPRALLGTAQVRAGQLIPQRLLSPLELSQTTMSKTE